MKLGIRAVARGSCLVRSSSSARVVPPNLQLADASSILQPVVTSSSSPKQQQLLVVAGQQQQTRMDYLFPPLEVPKSLRVRVFQSPGSFVDQEGEDAEVSLQRLVFGAAIRKDIIHEVIRYQRHKLRQPKKTKRIGEIAGSTKKPRPQKGTGSAQVGNRRNSVWRGGQKAHGPVIRDYSIGMNRKMRAMGMMIALSAKLREGNLYVFDKLACETHRTKDLLTLLAQHGVATDISSNALLVDDDFQENFLLASRNLPHATAMLQNKANVYDIVKRQKLVMSATALVALQSRILEQYVYSGKRKQLLIQSTLLSADAANLNSQM